PPRPRPPLFPYTTLFRSTDQIQLVHRRICAAACIDKLPITLHGPQATTQRFDAVFVRQAELLLQLRTRCRCTALGQQAEDQFTTDRKSTRLNSSHVKISY